MLPREQCSQAFNGCTCPCHYTPGMMHCMPCCYPSKDEKVDLIMTTKELSEQEIKPCPFCDGKDIGYVPDCYESDQLGIIGGFVMCNGCGAHVSDLDSKPEKTCIEVWNSRVAESIVAALRAEIERLKKQSEIDELLEFEKWLSFEFEFDEAFGDSGREEDIARRAWQARAQLERGGE
jgi:hypothetical protein